MNRHPKAGFSTSMEWSPELTPALSLALSLPWTTQGFDTLLMRSGVGEGRASVVVRVISLAAAFLMGATHYPAFAPLPSP